MPLASHAYGSLSDETVGILSFVQPVRPSPSENEINANYTGSVAISLRISISGSSWVSQMAFVCRPTSESFVSRSRSLGKSKKIVKFESLADLTRSIARSAGDGIKC